MAYFNSKTAKAINVGDYIEPDPLWNKTTRIDKLPDKVRVLSTTRATCQTGIMLEVKSIKGKSLFLDAGWFISS